VDGERISPQEFSRPDAFGRIDGHTTIVRKTAN